jgi:outer membrane protein TolC
MAFALAGCGTTEVVRPAAPLPPAAWQAATALAAQPAGAAWADPQLIALQNRALAANRDVAQASLRWQQALRLVAQSELRLQPSVGVDASASRPLEKSSASRSVEVNGVSIPVNAGVGWSRSFGASVAAGFEPDLWGRLSHATIAQVAQADAARTDIAAARALLLTQVAERYWTAAAAQAQLPLVQEQEKLAKEVLQLTALRVREGKLAPIEIDTAGTALLADQVRQSDLSADSQLQRHQLALLLDQALPGPDLQTARLPPSDPPGWALPAPSEALSRRPDVQRARLAVDAALARFRGAQADRYPRLSFSMGVNTGGGEVRQWLSQPLASLAANLVVPMVDWRRLDLQSDTARTDLELAALALRETLGRSLVEVEAQLIDRRRLQQQGTSQAARLNDLRQAERVAEAKFSAGSLSRLDWLQARRARLGGEQEQLQLQLRRWLNHVAMYRVLGLEMGEQSTE